jgi:hypothetical protein
VVPTVIAEPEPTPGSRGPAATTAAPAAPTMSLELAEVIADLGQQPSPPAGAATVGESLVATAPALEPMGEPAAPSYGHGTPFGTPPGTPSSEATPYPTPAHQLALPAHLIGLPPVEGVPNWDGTFQHPRRGLSPVVLTVLLLAGVALVTVLAILVARTV